MKRKDARYKGSSAVLAVLAGLLLAPAFLTAQQQSSSDAQIENAVVDALGTTPTLMDQPITAATIEGTVTLSGSVPDAASKQQAEALVKKIAGVKGVENNLEIQSAQASQPVAQPAQTAPPADTTTEEDISGAESGTPPTEPQMGNQQQAPEPGYSRQQQYSQQQQQPYYQQPSGPITIPPGTLVRLRTSETLDNRRSRPGDPVEFTAASDLIVGGALAIPRGAVFHGVVEDPIQLNQAAARQADSRREDSKDAQQNHPPNDNDYDRPDGKRTKYALALRLTDVVLEGQVYPLRSDAWTLASPSTVPRTASNVMSGALLGTMIGAIAGRGAGAAIGAVAGGTAGAVISASAPPPRVVLPVEALVSFHLQEPLSVSPVSPQEAQRLASGAYPMQDTQPRLYRRGPSPYYPPPPPPPSPYYGGGQVVYVP